MKKILMVCNYFAPDNAIAAVRITKFAKYLKQAGYEVTVIAEQKADSLKDTILEKDAEGIKVIRVSNSRKVLKIIGIYEKVIYKIKKKRFDNLDDRIKVNPKTGKKEFFPFQTAHPMIGSLDYFFEILRQHDLLKGIVQILPQYSDSDYVITSYGNFFGLYAGRYIHRKYKDIPWIVDIRDNICQSKFTPCYMRPYAQRQEHMIWKEADCIIGVSKGICRRVPSRYREKVHCITNGYDMADRVGMEKSPDNKQMVFSYTGSMYGGLQNLEPYFRCMYELIEEGSIEEGNIRILYAGKSSAYEIFRTQAQSCGMADRCAYMGMLERKEALKLQMESDVLLVSAFDDRLDGGGIITGKVLEYMSAGKPIIAIINGTVADSELGEIIKRGKLGFAYEEMCADKDMAGLKKYIKDMYAGYMRNGEIDYGPEKKILQRYDYRNLSRRMIRVLESHVKI